MDNYYQNCPPKMSDNGRNFSDFQSSIRRDEYIKYINDIQRDDKYRLFLQTNGKEILDREWSFTNKNGGCGENKCIHTYPTRSSAKQYASEMEAYNSYFNLNNGVSQLNPLSQCKKLTDFRMF